MVEKLNGMPEAYAQIAGAAEYPEIHGMVYFFEVYGGTIVMTEVYGLPDEEKQDIGKFFAFHIHEGGSCSGEGNKAFPNAGMHFNPDRTSHPEHAGDLPPLLSTHGAAWNAVYTGRFYPEDVIGKTVIIHSRPDDFRTQPSGDSGEKIACGEIKEWQMQPDEAGAGTMQPDEAGTGIMQPGMTQPEQMQPGMTPLGSREPGDNRSRDMR